MTTTNTNLNNVNTDISRHWTFGYNNRNDNTKHFYVHFKFRAGDKGQILMLLTGSDSGTGCMKIYKPIVGEINQNRINLTTVYTCSNGIGFSTQTIQKTSTSEEYILVILEVKAYSIIEMFSSNCILLQSYFAG